MLIVAKGNPRPPVLGGSPARVSTVLLKLALNENEASKWVLSSGFNISQFWRYYWYVSLSDLSYLGLIVISDKPDQATVEHFQMLRRQWASKAQLLMSTLDGLPDANTAAVQGKYQRTAACARSELEDPIFGQHERTTWLRFSRFCHVCRLQFWTRENHFFGYVYNPCNQYIFFFLFVHSMTM